MKLALESGLILLREGLEALLIVTALAAAMRRAGAHERLLSGEQRTTSNEHDNDNDDKCAQHCQLAEKRSPTRPRQAVELASLEHVLRVAFVFYSTTQSDRLVIVVRRREARQHVVSMIYY